MQNQNNNNQVGVSSTASYPDSNGYVDVIKQLEDALRCDAQRVQMLMQQGTISTSQGQYLITQLARKYNEINAFKTSVPSQNANVQPLPLEQVQVPENPMELFIQEHPDFFKKGARASVLDYIKDLDMDKDEISKIAKIVEGLETSAVDGYLKKSAHEKSLNDENAVAKSKLTSYAQNAPKDAANGRIFTREDIGRMTVDEFAKNEKFIMDQVKQGLIK